ncbi:MAG: tetratricopeptide repeat protein [Kiritimatiellae bacterium]|nr:tetratricopeptide repeat protein [Kiritimatiellia bacterium]
MKKRLQRILKSKYRDELTTIARDLRIPKYHTLDKEQLVSAILEFKEPLLREILSLNWWACYHNHIYGVATIIGLFFAIISYVQYTTLSPEELTTIVNQVVNAKMQPTSYCRNPLAMVASRMNISESELRSLLDEHAEAIKNDPSKKQEYIKTLIANDQNEEAATEAGKLVESLHRKRETLNNVGKALKHDEAEALSSYGLALLQLGKQQEALEKIQSASDLIADDIGHKQWFATQKLLALALSAVGRNDQALPLYLDIINREKKPLSEESRFEDSINLGQLTLMAGYLDSAEKLFTIAFNIAQDIFTRTDVQMAVTLLSLSQVAFEKKEYSKAEAIGRRYLGLLNETGRLDSVYAGAGFYNLAKILRMSGNTKDAMRYYNKALDIYKLNLGDEHLQVAMTYNEIGLLKMREYKEEESLDYFTKAISMAKTHKYGDFQVSMYVANQGRALFCMGNTMEARYCFEESLTLRQECLHPENSLIHDMETLINETYEIEQNQYRQLYMKWQGHP